jgi:hypothetical protein
MVVAPGGAQARQPQAKPARAKAVALFSGQRGNTGQGETGETRAPERWNANGPFNPGLRLS